MPTDNRSPWLSTVLVFASAWLLFSISLTTFAARVTDVSALRLLDGDVPYRDFWTMYAPGSFAALALAFQILGRELIVSNALGITTSAAAIALCYRLAESVSGRRVSAGLAALVAVAFFGTGYHDGFTSYPPAFALVIAAVHLTASRCERPDAGWAVIPGLLLGLAVLFKHDVAAYGAIAIAIGTLAARRGNTGAVLPPILMAASVAALPVAAAVVALGALGAGPDLWRDLVRFPMTDFKYVRPEYFPLVPRWHAAPLDMAQELIRWGICNLPTAALAIGIWRLVVGRSGLDTRDRFIVVCASIAFCLHWSAAHVQLNTHAISLTWWGGLIGAMGLRSAGAGLGRVALVVTVGWGSLFIARPAYLALTAPAAASEWVSLPGLRGIRATQAEAAWMRGLAASMADAADPAAPLLFVSRRNDMVVFAESVPFWLTPRRPVTRHHELHPGVTDTAATQREMLDDVARGPLPVVVREYRFDDATLDSVKAGLSGRVPVGSTLLDEWIADYYEPGSRFGNYEVMRRRPSNRP